MRLTFRTTYQWQHDNIGTVHLEDRAPLEVAPPPAFRGPKGYWSPEDLFVSAVETCLFLTFLGLVKRSDLTLMDYSSEAVGVLERTDDGLRFTRIDIYPVLEVKDNVPLAVELLEKAEQQCLVARSLSTRVHLEPRVMQARPTEE